MRLLNSIRLRRIAEGQFARVPGPCTASDVTAHPRLGGASRPTRRSLPLPARPARGGTPAGILPLPHQRQALRAGELHHRAVRHQVRLFRVSCGYQNATIRWPEVVRARHLWGFSKENGGGVAPARAPASGLLLSRRTKAESPRFSWVLASTVYRPALRSVVCAGLRS